MTRSRRRLPLLLGLLVSATAISEALASNIPETAQTDIRTFEVLSSEQILSALTHLAQAYPQFVTLTDAQSEHGLPAAGKTDDCPFDRTDDFPAGCRNYILYIEDKVAHPDGSASSKSLPEVFLSGALHGNERVGPSSVTEAASLLLEAAACEAMSTQDADPDTAKTASKCRKKLSKKGVTNAQRKWLARLVTTRRIVIVPTANALGYYRDERSEAGTDPNRDFPYDIKPENSDTCMRTIAGRTVNEIFRQHMFQLSLTFHAGMEAVTYEWGAPTYLDFMSPDDTAQSEIANGYSNYAGSFEKTPNYRTGTMNDVVYYVRGGMEDWAYAGSWDPDRVVQCTPKTYGGYPARKTKYSESTLRIFNMLVECSRSKTPAANMVGTTEDLLTPNGPGNGHIARNLRIALMAIDLVEPYVSILGADGVALTDDIVPSSDRTGRTCEKSKALLIPKGRGKVIVEWTVGGGFTVDSTEILHGKWDDIPASIDGSTHPTQEEWQSIVDVIASGKTVSSSASTGKTRWHKDGSSPTRTKLSPDEALGPVFEARIDVSAYSPGDRIAVFATARLDSAWAEEPDKVLPEVPPQSHVVNARTNPKWRHESAGKVVQGRLNWFSVPLTIIVGDDKSGGGTVEVSSRANDADKPDFVIDTGGGAPAGSGTHHTGGDAPAGSGTHHTSGDAPAGSGTGTHHTGGDAPAGSGIGGTGGSAPAGSGLGARPGEGTSGQGHSMVAWAAFGILVLFVCATLFRRQMRQAVYGKELIDEGNGFVDHDLELDEEDYFTAATYRDNVEAMSEGNGVNVELPPYSDAPPVRQRSSSSSDEGQERHTIA